MITLSIVTFALLLTVIALGAYGWGYWNQRSDQRHKTIHNYPRVEREMPLPHYFTPIDFEPLEHRPTVKLIKENSND
jgi:hypothetical protein